MNFVIGTGGFLLASRLRFMGGDLLPWGVGAKRACCEIIAKNAWRLWRFSGYRISLYGRTQMRPRYRQIIKR